MTANDMHIHLQELHLERALASIEGLTSDPTYMADLEEEIQATRQAYVGVAVSEIAGLRARLSGPQIG